MTANPWALWLRAAAIRVLRVGAAAAVATIGGQTLWSEVAWDVVLGVTLLAMLIEALLCVASLPEAPMPVDMFGTRDEAELQHMEHQHAPPAEPLPEDEADSITLDDLPATNDPEG